MAPHSNDSCTWKNSHGQESPGGLQSMKVGHDRQLHFPFSLHALEREWPGLLHCLPRSRDRRVRLPSLGMHKKSDTAET